MQLQTIKLSEAYESENNPRGKDFKGAAFDDLVASVKEKGVLMPVIVRPRGKSGKLLYEIVAGNRRFRAAQLAGLKEIPARIEELGDAEMQEIQIIENLQREDVHPLDEGEAYRTLVEVSKCEIPSIAAKVGKSETYVRQRIFLTNLDDAVAKSYRTGKLTDGHAVLIARLSANDQARASKFVTQSEYHVPSVSDLKEYIDREFYKPLEHQPWLKDDEAMAAVGPCKGCPPNVPSLFGAVKEGACTDKKCWAAKMAKYIAFRKQKDADLILITDDYDYGGNKTKGILYSGDYAKTGPKDKCTQSVMALVGQGRGLGSSVRVCVAKDCKTHRTRHSSTHRESPAEKVKREKEVAAAKAREEKAKQKDQAEMAAALKKVKWPLTKKSIDVLLECELEHDPDLDELCERRGIAPAKISGSSYDDYDKAIRKAAEKMTDLEKAQLIVEITLMAIYSHDKRKKIMKLL